MAGTKARRPTTKIVEKWIRAGFGQGEGAEYKPEALMDLTLRLMENQSLEFFTYNRLISFCDNCKKNWFGTLHKCPSCGSMSALATFDRFTST